MRIQKPGVRITMILFFFCILAPVFPYKDHRINFKSFEPKQRVNPLLLAAGSFGSGFRSYYV